MRAIFDFIKRGFGRFAFFFTERSLQLSAKKTDGRQIENIAQETVLNPVVPKQDVTVHNVKLEA